MSGRLFFTHRQYPAGSKENHRRDPVLDMGQGERSTRQKSTPLFFWT